MALDPVLQQILHQIPLPQPGELDILALRSRDADLPFLFGPEGPIKVAEVEHTALVGSSGTVPVRIFRPSGPTATVVERLEALLSRERQ
jgi:hypothetical protein